MVEGARKDINNSKFNYELRILLHQAHLDRLDLEVQADQRKHKALKVLDKVVESAETFGVPKDNYW
jgi:hypothetical protein